jgi:hypothetical protein
LLVAGFSVEALAHHIRTLLVVVGTAETVRLAGWHNGDSVERLVLLKSVSNVLLRRGSECLGVGGLQCGDRRVLGISVACERGSVVWTFVVVGNTADSRIETINDIRALHGSLLEVVRLAGLSRVPPDDVQRLVAFVSRVSLSKTARTTAMTAAATAASYGFVCRRRKVAGITGTVRGSCITVFRKLGGWARTTCRTVAESRAPVGA